MLVLYYDIYFFVHHFHIFKFIYNIYIYIINNYKAYIHILNLFYNFKFFYFPYYVY